MKRRATLLALAAAASGRVLAQNPTPAPAPAASAATAPPTPPLIGELKQIGPDRYQLGRITVDKRQRSFRVPGRVRVLDKPLEYLATTPTAMKAYETLLDLDTTGSELNLACILIGLERPPAVPSSMPLSVAGAAGPPVRLSVAWSAGGQSQRLSAAEALLGPEAIAAGKTLTWAYTGSFTNRDGSQLAADVTGTLISFIKNDRSGVIDAVLDTDPGPYGAIRGSSRLPPEGTPVELIVEAGAAGQ